MERGFSNGKGFLQWKKVNDADKVAESMVSVNQSASTTRGSVWQLTKRLIRIHNR